MYAICCISKKLNGNLGQDLKLKTLFKTAVLGLYDKSHLVKYSDLGLLLLCYYVSNWEIVSSLQE